MHPTVSLVSSHDFDTGLHKVFFLQNQGRSDNTRPPLLKTFEKKRYAQSP